MKTQIWHLSTRFHLLGRGAEYDELGGEGNPCVSVDVRLYRTGLARNTGAAAFLKQFAVLMTFDKYRSLMGYLMQRTPHASAIEQLLTYRDLVHVVGDNLPRPRLRETAAR